MNHCDACPFRDLAAVPCEPARQGRASLAVVGEAPGWNEVNQGRPFVGRSGQMLERGLKTIGLSRSQVHWTNAILCDVGRDDKKQKIAAKACGPRLRAELEACGAPVIMPVGAWALAGTMNLSKRPQIQKWRGSVSRMTFPGQGKAENGDPGSAAQGAATRDGEHPSASGLQGSNPSLGAILVAPTVHPAFVMRSPGWKPVLERDVARIGRLIANGFEAPEESKERSILIPKDLQSLVSAFKSLRGSEVSFDVETLGLGPNATPLVCYGLSDGIVTVVVPWSRGRDAAVPFWKDNRIVVQLTNELLRKRVMVTHNGPAFDHIVARRYGIQWGEWQDTLIASHVLRSHLPKNLAHVVTSYIDVPPWKQLEDRTATIERLWFYNARDCLYTILAWKEIKKELNQ